MMRSTKVSEWQIFYLLIGILLGVIFCNWSYFIFEKTIKITDILSIIITTFLGIYIASKIQTQVSSDRIEKDLIINELKDVKINVSKLTDIIELKQFDLSEIVKINKKISQNLDLTLKLISHCNYAEAVSKTMKSILTDFRQVNRIITSISPSSDGLIKLTDAQCFDISSKLKLIHEKIMLQIISTNRVE